MSKRATYSTLAFGGLLPFLAAALAVLLGVDRVPALGAPSDVLNSYGLVIVCFLAGVHWATAIYHEEKALRKLLRGSNIVLLAVWIVFVAGPVSVSLLAQLIALNVLLAIDFQLKETGLISTSYWHVRIASTLIASISIAIVILR